MLTGPVGFVSFGAVFDPVPDGVVVGLPAGLLGEVPAGAPGDVPDVVVVVLGLFPVGVVLSPVVGVVEGVVGDVLGGVVGVSDGVEDSIENPPGHEFRFVLTPDDQYGTELSCPSANASQQAPARAAAVRISADV